MPLFPPPHFIEFEPGTLLVCRERPYLPWKREDGQLHYFKPGDIVLLLSVEYVNGHTKAEVLFNSTIITFNKANFEPLIQFFRDARIAQHDKSR